MTPTPRQIKAGRALLGWNMHDLAAAAEVARGVIADYEREAREPKQDTLDKMKAAMEAFGLRFIAHGVQIDPNVRVGAGLRAIVRGSEQ